MPFVARTTSGTPCARAKRACSARCRASPWAGHGDARPRPARTSAASSSRRGWPETWTRSVRSVMTSMPWRDQAVDDRADRPSRCRGWRATRRSPGRPATARCPDARRSAMRASAARGSPCEPVSSAHDLVARQVAEGVGAGGTRAGRRGSRIRWRRRRRGPWRGRRRRPRGRTPAPPPPRTRMRATLEAKVVTATRCGRGLDELGEALRHVRLARAARRRARRWWSRRRAPARPRRRAPGSAPRRSGCRDRACRRSSSRRYAPTRPSGVRMASAFDSGIECATGTYSMSNGPSLHALARRDLVQLDLRRAGLRRGGGSRGGRWRSASRRPGTRRRGHSSTSAADMVLVGVGDEDAEQVLALVLDEAQVRDRRGRCRAGAPRRRSPCRNRPGSTCARPSGPKP